MAGPPTGGKKKQKQTRTRKLIGCLVSIDNKKTAVKGKNLHTLKKQKRQAIDCLPVRVMRKFARIWLLVKYLPTYRNSLGIQRYISSRASQNAATDSSTLNLASMSACPLFRESRKICLSR